MFLTCLTVVLLGCKECRRSRKVRTSLLFVMHCMPGAHHKSDPVVVGENMSSSSVPKLISEFNSTKQHRLGVQKAVWHNSLRLPQGKALTNEQWKRIADNYMEQMTFSDTHLRCYVLHDDSTGQHIHIITSRIDLSGGLALSLQERVTLMQ